MHNAQLIRYLSREKPTTLQSFQKFVDSPYFNVHQNTKKLLEYILSTKDWSSKTLSKEKAHQYIFRNQPYAEQKINDLISYLLRLYRQFLTTQQLTKNSMESSLALLQATLDNGNQHLFSGTTKKVKAKLDHSDIQNGQYYYYKSQFQQLQDNFDLRFGSRISGTPLKAAMENFDLYYASEKLRMACQMLARYKVTNENYDFSPLESWIEKMEQNKESYQTVPAIWIYYLIYKMSRDEDQSVYKQLKDRLATDSKQFPVEEGRDLYTHTLNFCIGQINRGNTSFRQETFEIYQQMLTNGFLYSDHILPQWDYTNIVTLGCETKAFEWTKDFIHQQKDFLPAQDRENTYTYNLAAYHYQLQQYDKAIELLQQVSFTDVYYNLLSRILLVKIYFETQNWQALQYALDTFRIYILRHRQIEENRKKSGLNLIRFSKKLLTLAECVQNKLSPQQKEKLLRLKDAIQQNDKVLQKAWLQQKVDLLLGTQ